MSEKDPINDSLLNDREEQRPIILPEQNNQFGMRNLVNEDEEKVDNKFSSSHVNPMILKPMGHSSIFYDEYKVPEAN